MGAFRVAVTGCRGFRDYRRLRDALDRLLAARLPDVVILTAGGSGADSLAGSYAVARRLPVEQFPADFTRHPVDAVECRNRAMVSAADALVYVPGPDDGHARRVVAFARARGLPVRVLRTTDAEPTSAPDPDPPRRRVWQD